MKTFKNPKLLQREIERLRKKGKIVGFVPTMGALHEGHLSLVRKARRECDVVVVSIFVNALQFGPKEDFKKYPRPVTRDKHLLLHESVDYLLMPTQAQMYPEGYLSKVICPDESLTDTLCGKFRPGHFDGVTTIVAKLFNIVAPHRAYFGLKDYQQAVVIQRMIEDLNFPIILRLLPIVREKDGLAMSSRNQYLSSKERMRALEISKTLKAVASWLRRGKSIPQALKQARARLQGVVDRVDYLELRDPKRLQPVKKKQPKMILLTACHVGKTRLIDNVIIRTS